MSRAKREKWAQELRESGVEIRASTFGYEVLIDGEWTYVPANQALGLGYGILAGAQAIADRVCP